MRQTRSLVAMFLVAILIGESVLLAVDSKGAAYFGGTVQAFKEAKDPVEGKLDTKNDNALTFLADDKPFKGQSFAISYASIVDLEYGQKAGRRVGAAAATTILLGPIGLLTLLSKKRNHYLTIGFKDDEGKDQVAVIELGKDIVRATLPVVETRSGKKIVYQDDEAQNSANK
jgi:hypothetical protein